MFSLIYSLDITAYMLYQTIFAITGNPDASKTPSFKKYI